MPEPIDTRDHTHDRDGDPTCPVCGEQVHTPAKHACIVLEKENRP